MHNTDSGATQSTCCDSECQSAGSTTGKVDMRWLKLALWLAILTVLYNLAEAVIAIFLGFRAGRIALTGFGFDSLIEISAAGMVLWRLALQFCGADDAVVEASETRVQRFVGFTFLMLVLYILFESSSALLSQQQPQESLVGIILAGLSLIIMPALAWGKIYAANRIPSPALRAEAKETIACSILSLILLVGLGANAWLGWWWADPVAGLCMIPWLVKEGIAGLRGESCCG